MKIIKLSLCISMVGAFATLPPAYANEVVTNCTQVTDTGGSDSNTNNNESCAAVTIPFDFGDAPETFPVLLANGGARHQLGTNVYLGKCVDGDSGELQGEASADDADESQPVYGVCETDAFGKQDDEDGVAIAELRVGDTESTVQVTTSADCKLNAWVDWNQDGSWGGAGEQVFLDQQLTAGLNNLTMDVPAFAAEGTAYTRFRCSTAGGDGIGGEAIDGEVEDYKLTILPAIPKVPVSVGDKIWIDANQNGQQDADETGLAGATVTLLDKDGNPVNDLDGKPVAAVTTDGGGAYVFGNLAEGQYLIRVETPEGYLPTQGGTDVDDDVSNTDSNCQVVDGKTQTSDFSLTTDNMTVDCGFYMPTQPVHSIGNMVWVDDGAGDKTNADNGQFDEGEALLNGIKLELRDTTGAVIESTMTSGGYYLFSGLNAGEYQVCVAATNFKGMGKLVGYTAGVNGKEADANTGGDSNDNGGELSVDGICSNFIVLNDQEPTSELPTALGTAGDDGMGTEDSRSNLTVDFAVLPPAVAPKAVSVGDRVWIDTNENGQQDAGETGLSGATVTLLDKSGNPVNDLDGKPVAAVTTAADGVYLFENLPEGEYLIRVEAPEGYIGTQGGADVDDDASNTDSNCQVVDGKTQTSPFNLTTDTLTADCGFYQPKAPVHSLGNRVWVDANNNGLADESELPASAGITLALKDAEGAVISSTTTDAEGRYLFSGLAAGNYQVCVVADNFATGSLLEGYTASTGGTVADANTDIDGDDNGTDDLAQGLCTNLVTLNDQEPTLEVTASGDDGNDGVGTEDQRSNLTIDFGIVPPVAPPKAVSVGDRVWLDTNENGQQDEGEAGLSGAVVTLLDKDGNPANDLDGKPVAAFTTVADGLYLFDNLLEGEYLIRVDAPEGYVATQGGADVDDDASNTDSNCQVVDGKTQTSAFNLTTDTLTVDCGFYLPKAPIHSVGNSVWVDANNNGLFDKGEQPVVDGVVMELLDKSGTVMAYTETKDGYYLFSGLAAGEYSVCVAHGNFDAGLLKGYTPSNTGDETDVNDGIDNGDNGDNDTQDGLCSNVIILDDKNPTGEQPTASGTAGDDGMGTDDNRSNLTVDFGVVPPVVEPPKVVSVGDTLWIDTNENGQQDEGEAGLAGAEVTLLNKDGSTVVIEGDMAVAPVITTEDGKYLFSNLPEGEYLISVKAPEGYVVTQGGADVDEDASNTDSNCQVVDGKTQTSPFNLTTDNLTVDCGFYKPVEPPKAVVVGDYLWIDANENGKQDAGEQPLSGATVTLLDKDGNPVKDLEGDTIAPVVTGADGLYGFNKLPEGEYSIRVQAPEGYIPTLNAGDVDDVPVNDDSNCTVVGSAVQTAPFTLMAGSEPDSALDGDGDNSNLTVDCGFYMPTQPVHSIGNMVWVDDGAGDKTNADNGQFDEGEALLNGIKLELRDTTGAVIESTMTSGGYYLFSGLNAGEYQVCVAATNFKGMGKLVGYTAGVNGKEADANTGGDSNDNGGELSADGICSNFIVLNDQEPTSELPTALGTAGDDGMGTEDSRSNLTVDFAVLPPAVAPKAVSVGDRVWIDTNENGQQDAGETGLSGATVTLLDKSGNPVNDLDGKPVAAVTTAADGVYLFENLPEGEYLIRVEAPEGYIGTQGGADVDDDASNTDSNCQVVDGKTQTSPFNLTTDTLTADCGFYQPKAPVHSLGNRVWVDANNNGLADESELPASAGITLALKDAEGAVISSTTTDAEGRYLFSGLAAGNYQVCVVADNFATGSLLEGYTASTGGTVADANTDIDGDDNGTDDLAQGLCTNLVTLNDQEPTLEVTASGDDGNDGVGTEDQRSNLTIDFGIVPPVAPPKAVSVGDRVWLDTNENGQQDEGEAGLSGAVVTLLDKDGNPANDLDGKPVAAFTTVADGLYLFDNLLEGEYLIRVDAPEGYVATQGGADVDDDASNTDSNCQVVDGKTQTSAFNLTTDTLTVDCGFYLPKAPIHSVGNSVWVDANNNGLFDKGEQPVVDGVVMELLDKSGTVMAYTETKDGYYLFSGLAAGEYSVCVAHGNFDAGLLKGYTPSNTGDETDVNDGIDNGDNGDNDTQDGLCSNVIILDDKNPTGEQPTASGTAGDDGMGTDDNRSNLTVDFGVVPPVVEPPKVVSVGDTLWIDTNENGQQDAGETGFSGATVTLLDKSGNPVNDLDGKPVAAVTTAADGLYLFENLPAGEYLIRVDAPEGYVATQGGAAVDDDTSNTDSNCQVVDGKTQTSAFNLTTDNLTVDCGFYLPKAPTHSIGNTVWVDANNNGLLDAEESKVVDGVVMELLDKSGTVMAYTETKDGYYLFSGLAAGEYSVCVAHGNFDEGLLKGYTGSPVMEAAGDNRNSGDSDTQDGLCSNVIVLDDKQPTDEAPTASGTTGDDGMGTDDNRSNLAVDFGVVPPEVEPPKTVSVGDFIWIDANENGQQDEGETGLAGATVTLLDKSGNPVSNIDGVAVAPVTTGVDGKYTFINLPEGEYQIRVETPEGYLPTQGVTDALASNTDSNCQVMDGKLQTSLFSLTADTTAVDCGFYQPKAPTHSLGNMVWIDNGEGDNANNGLFDTGETLPGNVVMELRDSTDALVNTTQTAGGYYLFSGLAAGEYKVCVAGSNFNAGAALEGYTASITGKELNANLNGDSNDNGDSTASDGLCSNLIVLDGEEPTGEQPTASGIAGDDGMGTEDNRSNLTVDFAVVPVEPVDPGTPVSVGNQIWIDSNANGQREEGESFLENAVVTLTDASGRSVMDLDGNSVAPHTTGADGLYLFENLPEGEYIVTVEPPEGFFPTIGGIDVDDDASDIDSNCRVNPINNTVETHPFTLAAGSEPDADGDDTNGNMTVDCGFYGSVSLGDRVWLDGNANGQQDNAETGINGVSVSLMEEDGITPATDISGKPVAAVMTDENGNYLFPNLKPGNYIVVVNPGTDSGYSLTKGGADPDTDPSNTDSNCKVAAGQFQTPAVTLTPGKEPNDNGFSDLTVDCGMLRPVNLGSRLWLDLDGDGKQDGGEPGIPGATVTLLTVDGKPVTDIFGDVLKPQTTDSDGKYFFGNLREGDYVVKVVPPAGYLPTVGGEDPNDDDATDSNGVLNADGSIISKPINLKWGDEPEDGGATNTTVGFGLVANLHVPTLSQWGMAIMSMLLATAAFFRRRRED